MNYKSLTVYNYKVFYYLIRVLAFFMLGYFYVKFSTFSQRSDFLYHPTFFVQELVFPEFPSQFYYVSLLLIAFFSLIISLVKPNIVINVILFVLMALLNTPISAYNGAGHNNHLFVLSFFFSIFLLPQKLKIEDYKSVQFFYAGLLSSYFFAGFWKIVSVFRDLMSDNPRLSWIDIDAAKINTLVNYHNADVFPSDFIFAIYDYKIIWVIITSIAIILQTLSILGTFNRKYLTFTMIYLVVFHLYNKYFVIADFTNAILVVLVVFFPYHLLKGKLLRT